MADEPVSSDAVVADGAAIVDAGEQGHGADTEELLGLIDRLEGLLAGSDLDELEVQVGSTGLLLRKPSAVAGIDAPVLAALAAALRGAGDGTPARAAQTLVTQEHSHESDDASRFHQVVAPLTGIYYGSPSPGAGPYVREGGDVNVGQVIGLIEAMKLFNEIKSDVSGRVVRIVAENGKLVKHRQPLIEVDPS